MNKIQSFIYVIAVAFLLSCGSNNENAAAASTDSEARAETEQATAAAASASKVEGIVGEWELVLVAPDENGNEIIDENEKAKSTTNMQDYMKLNSDGSAEFYLFKAKGRYEIRANESSGKKYLIYTPRTIQKLPKEQLFPFPKMRWLL